VSDVHDELLSRHGLLALRHRLHASRRQCRVGEPCASDAARSYLGGLPRVDEDFRWPEFRGCPLELVASVQCAEIGTEPHDGTLLFFRHDFHTGFSADELGAARVILQRGDREIAPEQVPSPRRRGWLGTRARFRVYPRRPLTFRDGWSYPEQLAFEPDQDELQEQYLEFLAAVQPGIQHGGIASPANADDGDVRGASARASAKLVGESRPEDWELLLQVHDTEDLHFGDVGSVCWFALREDLARGDYSRTWAVLTCG
jgi:hypothetical protein